MSHIIKASREADLYLEWSKIVGAPTFIGNRKEIAAYLKASRERAASGAFSVEQRLARADRVGDSMLDYPWGFDDPGIIIFEQRGMLRRPKVEAFARILLESDGERLNDEQWDRLMDQLEPFDDQPGEPVDRERRA